LVIVAFGENSGGYGGTIAAPMVRALMTTWFRGTADAPAQQRP
jgi:penicillin-binding protein 2